MSMKIAVVGAGPSGLYFSLELKNVLPDCQIEIFEKENKALKKMRATGNGHCNILPEVIEKGCYGRDVSIPEVAELSHKLENMGIPLRHEAPYGYYPHSYSAPEVSDHLLDLAYAKGIVIHLGERLLDYEAKPDGVELSTSKGKYGFDYLVLASGGKSRPELGSDGSILEILKKHNIEIVEPRPGLTPLSLKDKDLTWLDGIRQKARVTLFCGKREVYSEVGEILYRKNGLSGIVIFNIQRVYAHLNKKDCHLSIDLAFDKTEEDLAKILSSFGCQNGRRLPQGYFVEPLRIHIEKRAKEKGPKGYAKTIKNLLYEIEGSEGFDKSQVTIGGVSQNEIEDSMRLKKEPSVFAIGEMVDIDGKCGGYNLAWCLYSALLAANAFKAK